MRRAAAWRDGDDRDARCGEVAPSRPRFLVDHPDELATISKAIVEQAMADPDTKGKMKDVVEELITD
ncbi:MAG: hypothetical protein M3680_16105 [Myxococcota bacterium]|nr:hypothetical protein [Myxococcota bacterium]